MNKPIQHISDILSKVRSNIKQNPDLLPLFETADSYIYTNQVKSLKHSLGKTSKLYLPIETDTEFWHLESPINNPISEISRCLTVQHRAITHEQGIVLAHPDSESIARHPLIRSGFTPIDYLNQIGIPASVERCNYTLNLPVLQIDLYGFFLVAELYRVVTGDFRNDINQLVLSRRDDNTSIEMVRRLIASTIQKGNRAEQFVMMPWVVKLWDYPFQAAIAFYDCCAVHGNTNYATFCANSGVELKYKDNFTNEEKARMQQQYVFKPDDFDAYALGDLQCYQALAGNMSKFQTIYKSLGISSYFEPPRLTIGATVARIVRSSILKSLGLELKDKNRVIELCRYGTSAEIKAMKTTTAVYNAKVDGGRCRNNRPIDVSVHRPIADADIAGCYGNGLKHQDFPLGRPMIIDYKIKSDNNNYLTLRKFLKKHGDELVPGLWQARVSTPKDYSLKYAQDFLISWVPPKDPSKIPTDSDLQEIDWYSEDNIGITKIFTEEVNLALINQEFLDWLENTASFRQRKELLDNLYIITAMFYPASERCKDVTEFFQAIGEHEGSNECLAVTKKRKSKKISIEQECYSWMSVNLGDLLVSQLLLERSKYKSNPNEKPLNELYKLCINTIYGDMVSPFFDIGNVVVGNNITARARAMAWYMEKGLNGFQTITDGCAFELNRVIHPGVTRISSETVFNTYSDSRNAHYTIKPIGNVDRIETTSNEDGLGITIYQSNKITQLKNKDAKKWLEDEITKHLKTVFPNVSVIEKFAFEIKDIYDAGAFHGTANYKFRKDIKTEQGKMRSYSKKHQYNAYTLTGDELQLIFSEYKPSEEFLENILLCPFAVKRSHAYIATKILKIGEYKAHYESRWSKSEAFPGCTVEMGRLLRECSLTQFTFKNLKQFQSWEREAKRLRDMTGHTYESWFLNEDGTLDFKAMVLRLDTLIRSGEMRFSTSRPTASQRHLAREYEEHPAYPALMKCKHQLGIRYGFIPNSDSDEFETLVEVNSTDLDITDL